MVIHYVSYTRNKYKIYIKIFVWVYISIISLLFLKEIMNYFFSLYRSMTDDLFYTGFHWNNKKFDEFRNVE